MRVWTLLIRQQFRTLNDRVLFTNDSHLSEKVANPKVELIQLKPAVSEVRFHLALRPHVSDFVGM